MIQAKPNRNGNPVAHFAGAVRKLIDAEVAVADAIALIRTDVMHGRNYQHKPMPMDAREDDLRKLDGLIDAQGSIHRLKEELMDVLKQAAKENLR